MIDTSGSTAKDLKFELESAARFLHVLLTEGRPEDAVALYSFNYDIDGAAVLHAQPPGHRGRLKSC